MNEKHASQDSHTQEPVIISDSAVMGGKPVIRGTQVTVELLLRKFAAGYTTDEILEEHPTITRKQIKAALEFTVRLVHPDYMREAEFDQDAKEQSKDTPPRRRH